LHNGEFYALTFIQITVSIANYGIVMNEYIFAILTLNETVTFATVEPLNDALLFFRHDLELLSQFIARSSMGSKSKDKSLVSELMLIKQLILAHYYQMKSNTFIRIPENGQAN
jgi:hypothetical protein